MATQPAMPRGTRSQSPSAKFYSRNCSSPKASPSEGRRHRGEEEPSSGPHSKRRKLNPASDTETAMDTGTGRYRAQGGRAPPNGSGRQRDPTRPKRAPDMGTRAPRASSGSAYTKRASALNLHNYPADHHPVGLAIWVIQKIDSARRERSGSTSSKESSPAAFSRPSSRTGIFQTSGQASGHVSEADDGDDPVARRQAQRERKIKQRLENWAKNKENDVVARAKLDAKKKFGSNPSTKPNPPAISQVEKPSPSDEKAAYISRRIKDDFTRLMNRQTKAFADDVAKLEPFQPGFGQTCFPYATEASASDTNLVTAGRLLVNVLPALAEKEVSRTSQLAADNLIQALETGALSTESFFDAIAILADNEEILVGTDRILAQLFSRSASSGNSKALRTSSGADSKLFATTNGPFIIYNTIENTDTTGPRSSRRLRRPTTAPGSAPTRVSPRDSHPTAKMLGLSDTTAAHAAITPRTSPPKVLKLTRSSKLRGNVSFADSPSPPRMDAKLVDAAIMAPDDDNEGDAYSKLRLSKSKSSLNQYRSEQPAPPEFSTGGEESGSMEVSHDLVQNLLDLALSASQEYGGYESELDGQGPSAPRGDVGIAAPSVRLLPTKEQDSQHSSTPHKTTKVTVHGHKTMSLLNSAPALSADQMTRFIDVIGQLPTSETNLSKDQLIKAAASYDSLAQGPAFEKAKAAGLSYPEIPRPFADRDGWRSTGVINEFGEEMVEIDRQSWVYPSEGGEENQQPLPRLKRKLQLQQEHIYGFPPVAGSGNGARHKRQRSDQGEENVVYEKLMFDIRKAADLRGLPCANSLSWEELADSIRTFDAANVTSSDEIKAGIVAAQEEEEEDSASSAVGASDASEIESGDDSDYEPEATATRNGKANWTGVSGAQTLSFVGVNGRRKSLRKPKGTPSSSSSSARAKRDRAMEISTMLDSTRADMSPPPRPSASSPPSTSTRYDIRPPTMSGTYNTFNGPITSSNTPAASPAGTPSFLKLNLNLPPQQPSTSPGPNHATTTRRQSTASTTSSASTSLLISPGSRAPSAQSLDLDNAASYNAAKGYYHTPAAAAATNHAATTTPNTNTNSSSHSVPGSPNGLNGGFPGGGIIINAPDKRAGDGRGQRRKSKAPDFKMTVQKTGSAGPKVQPKAVRGGQVMKF